MYADQVAWRKLISGMELSSEAQRWMKLDMLYPKLDEHEKIQESAGSCRTGLLKHRRKTQGRDDGLNKIDGRVEICRDMPSNLMRLNQREC